MDLQTVFTAVCNMTITASVVLGCVLLARLALGKAPKGFVCALWLVVLFRLLCPVAPSAPVSVLSVVETPRVESGVGAVTYFRSPVQAPLETMYAAPSLMQEAAPSAPAMPQSPIDWHLRMAQIWAVGLCALSIYGVLSYVDLRRKLRESVPVSRGVREADGVRTPFVLGFLRPTIYLPSDLPEEEREYILLHERFHIRRGDYLVRALFFLAVCIHWFNPLVWLAFGLCTRDMEMRCDEAVLKRLGGQIRCDYAQSLLKLATGRRMPLCAPLAFGEGDTGKRVKHVLKWKRGKLWLTIPAAVLCAAVLALTACDPAPNLVQTQRVFDIRYRAEAVLGEADGWIYYPRTYDFQLCRQNDGEQIELGQLAETRLGAGFDLSDESLEQQLRQENDLAWRTGEYWLLYQTDGSVYLTEGRDRVLRLDPVRQGSVRVQTAQAFGNLYGLTDYPAGSGLWAQEPQDFVAVSGEAILVFTISTEEKTLNVVEEYHRMEPNGTETVTETPHILERTRDYGYELPIARRGAYDGDWAMYRVDLGLSSYVFYVRFGMAATQTRDVAFSEGGAGITLRIPEGWSYSITSLEENEYSAGITFWPTGREEGVLRFDYYPRGFGVCGTGLETEGIVLAGQNVTAGTYDNEPLWTFLSFGGDFAVWGENHESWWAEYGETAMEILDSAVFGAQQ